MRRRTASYRSIWPWSRFVQDGMKEILEIGDEGLRAGVQRRNKGRTVSGPDDFDAAVQQVDGRRSDAPFPFPNAGGFGLKIELFETGVQSALALRPRGEQFTAARAEAALKRGEKGDGLQGDDARKGHAHRRRHLQLGQGRRNFPTQKRCRHGLSPQTAHGAAPERL